MASMRRRDATSASRRPAHHRRIGADRRVAEGAVEIFPHLERRVRALAGRIVLAQMRGAGFISADEEREAAAQMGGMPQASRAADAGAEYAIDYVLDSLPPEARTGGGEIIVETTLDKPLEARASEILHEHRRAWPEPAGEPGCARRARSKWRIRALARRSCSYSESQYTRAVKASGSRVPPSSCSSTLRRSKPATRPTAWSRTCP